MASQIAHIVYAEKYFEKMRTTDFESVEKIEKKIQNQPKIEKDQFFLGCVFPDIRRIAENLKRKDTHLCFQKLNLDFSGIGSFQAGWKFHLYCDFKREEILTQKNFYSLEETKDFYGQMAAKMLEDELIYDNFPNWEKLENFFSRTPFVETGLNLTSETFRLWYAIVGKYIEKKPDGKSIGIFLSKQQNLTDRAEKILQSLAELKKNKKIINMISAIKDEILE